MCVLSGGWGSGCYPGQRSGGMAGHDCGLDACVRHGSVGVAGFSGSVHGVASAGMAQFVGGRPVSGHVV